jgi:signal transduction histidine kinase
MDMGSRLVRILVIALGYVAVARFSLLFVVQPEGVASFWPPSGYMLAALLLTPGRDWRWLLPALFAANLGANVLGHNPVPASLGFAAANCIESLVAALAISTWLGRRLTMGRLREVIGFVGLGPLISNLFTAMVGAAVPALAFGAPFWSTWRVWWISDSMGMLLVTPVILSWADETRPTLRNIRRTRALEGALIFGGMVVASWLVFHTTSSGISLFLPYATFPFILWAAVRFGPRGGSTASLLVALIAVWYTARSVGPFADADPSAAFRVLSVQAFLSVASLCSLLLGALIDERRQAEEALRSAYATLETRIEERTRELSTANQALQSEVSERARAEDEVKRAMQELGRSNAELEAYAYVASHDLQEPLRAVAGTVQLLQARYQGKLDERADELISHAVAGITRMKALISDLLLYSRIGVRGTVKPTDCGEVMKEVLSNLAASIGDSGAQVTCRALPIVVADPTQMTQLFQNLIGNAVKFRGDRHPEIQVEAERLGDEVKFAVRDNGIGIESQYLDRIFGVFQRLHTRSAYPGNGIGLAVCKKIVERHGGRIWVESVPGRGTTFLFTLPAVAG